MCDFPTAIPLEEAEKTSFLTQPISSCPSMDPLYEQQLRDEVIYLHSLWHQGPPRSAAAAAAAAARHNHHLRPVQATQFKKESKPKTRKNFTSYQEPNSSPGLAWTVPSPPPTPPSDVWPTFESKPDPNPQTLSPEDQSKLATKNAHHNALVAFFRSSENSNADSDFDSDSDSISEEDDDSMDEDDDGREECDFFDKVFKEDTKLRGYYEKSFAKGEFSCLVFGALGGKKMGKKFNGCMALVQHSITIAKTKRRRAHRAFGEAVCKVLGWDINSLPSIVSLLGDNNPGETREAGSGDNRGSSVESDVVEGKKDEGVPESGPIGTEISTNADEGDTNTLTCNDADKSSEGVDMVHDLVEPAAHGWTNNSSVTMDGSKKGSGKAQGLQHHSCGDDNKEKSTAIVENVFTVEGKTDESIPESGAIIGAGISLDSDEGDMSSSNRTDADKSSEVLGMVQEPASDSLPTSSLSGPDAHQNSKNVGPVVKSDE